MLLVKLPWSARVWALPFLTVLCPVQQEGQPHKICRYRLRRQAFISMQFAAQQSDYQSRCPAAQYQAILLDEQPLGRFYVDRGSVNCAFSI
jgi:hypothetical protein